MRERPTLSAIVGAWESFDDVGGDHSMHLSIGIDVLRSRWMNILQQTIHMYIEQGKEYTMSCAPNKVCLLNDVECDPRQLSYPPLVPFLFANDKKKNSWSWGNILDILLVITVNSDRAVARHLREHFPSNEFGVSSATHVELEKDSETFQNLQFQYEILVHLLGNSCSKLLKSFVCLNHFNNMLYISIYNYKWNNNKCFRIILVGRGHQIKILRHPTW